MDDNDVSYEPMEVDLSSNSVKMDNSIMESTKDTYTIKSQRVDSAEEPESQSNTIQESKSKELPPAQTVKKYHITIRREKSTNHKSTTLLTIVIALVISIVTYQVLNFKCSDVLDLNELKDFLLHNIYGQNEAIDVIINTLAISNVSSKILFFYGGTGVGKTLAASLILESMWNSSNVYHYTMPSFATTFATDLMVGLTLCQDSFLVVDDLTRNDMHIKAHIKEFVAKSEYLQKRTTVILIFNCDNITEDFVKKCDGSFYAELKQSFRDVMVFKQFVNFKPLSEEHLRLCIKRELVNKELSNVAMDNILKNFNVSLDGCKRVHSKIKFLNVV